MNFLKSLASRKLLLAVAAFLVFVANGDHNQAMAVVLAYLGVQGYKDLQK